MRDPDVFALAVMRRQAVTWLLVAASVPWAGGSTALAGARDLPAWLDAARATLSPAPSATLHAHRLLHERHVRCATKGRNLIVDRGAIRILDRQGADEAGVALVYERTSALVRGLQAWLVGTDGRVKLYGEHDAVDRSLAEWGTLKTDQRALRLSVADAGPGAVFAWEWTVEEEPLFADQPFVFDTGIPTAVERTELELPAGFEPKVLAFGSDLPAPTRSGNLWRWERRDLPALADEPASSTGAAWERMFVVSPRAGPGAGSLPGRSFTGWADVARWLAGLSEASAVPSPSIVAAASAVPALPALERARALGRSVQKVNYVSVDVGLARGEGYRPHPATDVLQAGFGDCKDKANLFCTLARAAGLEAWLVLVSTKGREHVRPDWPSPAQFNHCIAALRVPEGTRLDAVVEATPFGTLLFFDPTDAYTPVGDLPDALQGSWALIEAADNGTLLRLPAADTRRARSRWTFHARIDSAGALEGTWDAVLGGGAASAERSAWAQDQVAARARIERMLTDWLGGSRIDDLRSDDRSDSNVFHIRFAVRADRFGRRMGTNMLALRTAPPVAAFDWKSVDTTRRTPVALPARMRTDSIIVELPPGWHVDELPEPVSQDRDFGAFSARWAEVNGALVATLEMRLEPVTLPPVRYRELLQFGEAVWRARRTQVVLVRR